MKLLLAPHPDDDALFCAFIALREKPRVVFCFDGAPRHGAREVRIAEASAAMEILGCEWTALSARDTDALHGMLARIFDDDVEHVWAPLPETDGNSQHNAVGHLAVELWPGRVTFYTTYTTAGRTRLGAKVKSEAGWAETKWAAMNCYVSQKELPGTAPHFQRGLDEYEVCP